MTADERAIRILTDPAILMAVTNYSHLQTMVEFEILDAERQAIKDFVKRVNARAEKNMELTGKLEGAHYAAMQAELDELEKWRIKVEP